jgi:hypothetical protein
MALRGQLGSSFPPPLFFPLVSFVLHFITVFFAAGKKLSQKATTILSYTVA